jgi:MoaA/NifB/PqqE/SkfB family radical SAM enzyme
MRTAILYIAERCNQSCVFCLEEDGGWNEFVDPGTSEVFAILEQLYRRGARSITFMGGETFFRKDLPPIVARAREIGYTRIGVATNGTVLARKGLVGDLVGAGLDLIELSVHGHTEELATRISRSPITFSRQADAMREINATGTLFTIVNVVICRENAGQLNEVARYVASALVDVPIRFKLKFVSLQGWAAGEADSGDGEALSYQDVDFSAVGDALVERGLDFWFCNVPLCRLGRHTAHAHELHTLSADEQYFDLDHRGPNEYYDSGHQLEGRVWPEETCARCSLRPVCPGLEESHRRVHGIGALSTRSLDPRPLVETALRMRGLDPRGAADRLRALSRAPRPSRFVQSRPDGALRFQHPDEELPFDILVDARDHDSPAYLTTARFALSYRLRSDADREPDQRVHGLLERAAEILRREDARGATLEQAREAIASAAQGGWKLDPSSRMEARPKKTGRLPGLNR